MGSVLRSLRKLKAAEQRFLFRRLLAMRGIQASLMLGWFSFLAWGIRADDIGIKFITAVLFLPAFWGARKFGKIVSPLASDLKANRVESIVGKVGALGHTAGLMPIRLGEKTFMIPSELLNAKKVEETIVIDFLPESVEAIAVDDKPVFFPMTQWLSLFWDRR
jgi:hypothetical protein